MNKSWLLQYSDSEFTFDTGYKVLKGMSVDTRNNGKLRIFQIPIWNRRATGLSL